MKMHLESVASFNLKNLDLSYLRPNDCDIYTMGPLYMQFHLVTGKGQTNLQTKQIYIA